MRTRVLEAGLVALVLLATLGGGGVLPHVHLPLLVGVALLLAWEMAGLTGSAYGLSLSGAPGAFLAFLALATVGAVVAPAPHPALLTLRELTVFCAAAWLAARCGPTLGWRAGPVLLGAGALLSLHALVQHFGGGEARPPATFINANHFAAWLAAALVAAWGPALATVGGLGVRAVSWRVAATAPIAVAIYLSGSRGVILALAAGGGVLLLGSRRQLPARTWRVFALGAAALVALAVLGVAVRLRSGDPFQYHRLRIWRASLGAVAEAPWTGTGPGQFETASANLNFPLEEGPLRYERFFHTPHSDWLRVPCEFGLPAAAALLAAALLAVRTCRLRLADASSTGGTRGEGTVAALAALAVQASVETLSQRPALWLLAAIFLGSTLAVRRAQAPPRPAAFRFVACVVVAWGLAVVALAPAFARRAREAVQKAPPERRLVLAERAIRFDPVDPQAQLLRGLLLAGTGEAWNAADYALARESVEHAIRLAPRSPEYRVAAGRIEALACRTLFRDEGTRARMRRRYDEAALLAQHDPFIRIEAATRLLGLGDPRSARRAAESALRIEPEAVAPRLVLAEAALAMGGPDGNAIAARWLAEAEASAARWADWPKPSRYARDLLGLDRSRAASLRRRIHPVAAPARRR